MSETSVRTTETGISLSNFLYGETVPYKMRLSACGRLDQGRVNPRVKAQMPRGPICREPHSAHCDAKTEKTVMRSFVGITDNSCAIRRHQNYDFENRLY